MGEWQDTGEVEKLGLDFKRQIFSFGYINDIIGDRRKKTSRSEEK